MWRSRLFWKLFASYTALNLVATAAVVSIMFVWQHQQVVDQIRLRLHESATVIRNAVESDLAARNTEAMQRRVRELSREIDTRITIVDMDGEVVADSSQETVEQVAQLENHKVRPELIQATSEAYGTSQRMSPTLGHPMLYVAIRADVEKVPIGLVRTALPMNTVLAEVANVQRVVWPVALTLSLSIAALTYILAARIVRPVQTLTTAAEAVAAGRYEQRPFLPNHDELGMLAKSFNRMTRQLDIREAQLRESSHRLKTVLEGMVEGVIALNSEQQVVLANRAAGRLLKFDPIEAEGRPLLELVRNRAMHDAIATAADGGTRRIEVMVGDDENLVIGIHSTLLTAESTMQYIVVLEDVTELRRLETLRQDFVANASHELKTPLASIKAYSETLLNGAIHDDTNNRRFLERIDEQAERLHELILDLLSIAKIESGEQAFEITEVNLAAVGRNCVAEQQPLADAREVTLRLEAASDSIPVQADPEGLRQIFSNLIDNAAKYTPPGGSITVTCRTTETDAVIEVRDTGIGISSEHLPRLFERFYRVDKARSRELGGTGLGLSIVKHMALSFGGRVEVDSVADEGSVFTIVLPLA